MLEFIHLAQQCAPAVAAQTMAAIVRVESGFNPFAIGVVGGRLERQPRTKDEAVATAKALHEAGWNFSIGPAQVNRHNLPRMKLSYETAFDWCNSLRAGAQILQECYERARVRGGDEQAALRQAISCYYSGNFSRGFQPDKPGGSSYVQRVVANAGDVAVASGAAPAVRSAVMPTPAELERSVVRDTPAAPAPMPPSAPTAPSMPHQAASSTPTPLVPQANAQPAPAVPALSSARPEPGPVALRVVPAISVKATTGAIKAPSAAGGATAAQERGPVEAEAPRSAAIVF